MIKSDQIADLAVAFVAAQAEMPNAKKDSLNPHFNRKYADLASVIEVARPVLAKHDLSFVQIVEPADDKSVSVQTILLHKSGQFLGGVIVLPAEKGTPQAFGSAISYARRYAISALLGIASEEDDDAEAAMPKPAPKGFRPKSPPQRLPAALERAPLHAVEPTPIPADQDAPPEEEVAEGPPLQQAPTDFGGALQRLTAKIRATVPGDQGRLERLKLSKEILSAKNLGLITPEEIAALRKVYDEQEHATA